MAIRDQHDQQLYQKVTSFFLSKKSKVFVEKILISIGIILFTFHLILYAGNLYHVLPFSLSSTYFNHPLNTLYTPFSFILIAEVYLLIYYLPTSFTRSVGKQLEIVCLIEIRSVFKYVYDTENSKLWPWETPYFLHTIAAIGLAACLVLLYRIRPRREARLEDADLVTFIKLKKMIAMLLVIYLIGLSLYSFGHWCADILGYLKDPNHKVSDPNSIFYGEFFTALILVDVLLLLISSWYIDDFGITLRNCGFVISTIILRLSFNMDGWYSVSHSWFAGLLAVTMLLLQQGLKWRSKAVENRTD